MPVRRVLVFPSVAWCSLLMVVGRVCDGRVAVFCCVPGYGGRRAWRSMLSPAHGTPFPFRPLHAWPVWCWPACVWSVYGPVVAAAAVWSVHGRVTRLMVGCSLLGLFCCCRRSTAPFGTAWHSIVTKHRTAQHSTAHLNTARYTTAQHCLVPHSTEEHYLVQLCAAQHHLAAHGTAGHGLAGQHSR